MGQRALLLQWTFYVWLVILGCDLYAPLGNELLYVPFMLPAENEVPVSKLPASAFTFSYNNIELEEL